MGMEMNVTSVRRQFSDAMKPTTPIPANTQCGVNFFILDATPKAVTSPIRPRL